MSTLFQDLRYALRTMLKRPGFNLIAVVTLALGIGSNAAIFSLVSAVLLRPLPLSEPERLMTFWHSAPLKGLKEVDLNDAQFAYYRDRTHTFESIAAYEDSQFVLSGNGNPEVVVGARVTFNYFDVLGRQPLYGRAFLAQEDAPNRNHVAILSYGLWQRRFGGDPKIVSQSVRVDNEPTTIVGVMPPGFDFPDPAERGSSDHMQLWVPKGLDPQNTDSWNLTAVGRLKPGMTGADAQREMAGLYEDFAREFGPRLGAGALGSGVSTVLMPLQRRIVGEVRTQLLLLLGAITLVLLIACANLANLLLARAVSRQRENALRRCLGASTWRIARQALIESFLLSLGGAVVGLIFASWSVAGLKNLISDRVPHLDQVRIDSPVLLFTVGLALATAVLCGLGPALRSARANLQDAIKESARGSESISSRRLKNAFVISQLALSLVLLIGAALLLQSLRNLLAVNPGFRVQNVLMAEMSLPDDQYPDKGRVKAFYDLLLERVRALPGVQAAELCNVIPFSGDGQGGPFIVEGQEPGAGESAKVAWLRSITPGYFGAMNMAVLQGRSFQSQDTENSLPVAIVDEQLVRMYWAHENPIGKRLRLGGEPWMTVVGVVPNVKNRRLDENPMPYVYRPYAQWVRRETRLAVRTTNDPATLISSITQQLANLDPELPLANVSTIEQAMARSLNTTRVTNGLLTGFAVTALLLAMMGIYGVMSLNVSSRTNEFGIRLALGAQTSHVLRIVMSQGLRLALVGVTLGLLASFALTRLMQGVLFGVKPTEPLTFIGVAGLLALVTLLACYLPARRATKVDPLVALRRE